MRGNKQQRHEFVEPMDESFDAISDPLLGTVCDFFSNWILLSSPVVNKVNKSIDGSEIINKYSIKNPLLLLLLL